MEMLFFSFPQWRLAGEDLLRIMQFTPLNENSFLQLYLSKSAKRSFYFANTVMEAQLETATAFPQSVAPLLHH